MLICIPSTITEINATHECNATVDNAKFFMVCPVKHGVFANPVKCFQCIVGDLASRCCRKFEILERRHEGRLESLSVREMVRVTKDGDVRMEIFQSMLCMVRADCQRRCN